MAEKVNVKALEKLMQMFADDLQLPVSTSTPAPEPKPGDGKKSGTTNG